MRSIKTFSKSLSTALVVLGLTAMPVLAATTALTSTSLTILAGTMSLTADPSASLASVTVSSSDQTTYTGTTTGNDASDISVTAADTRGEVTPSGWSVTATVARLTNGGVNIPVTNFSNNFSSVTAVSGSATGISAGSAGALVDTNADGTSDSFSVITASSTNGQGEYSLNMGLDLTVPAYQPAGTYSGSVDMSIS